mmetsp:Transcript_13659/g.26127  ORF Transcript_13659/g.26127 Transcript_13659/m.26127 type:complete len:229 (+) Transcript_13659:122-808(+)
MSLFRNAFTKVGRRFMSTAAAEEGSAAGGLVLAVGTTFGTYMMADFLSNFIQHPSQKMDYGYFNQFLNRPVDQNWWGTRTQHIVGVAAALAVTDHTSQAIFTRALGKPLSFAAHPAAFVAHTFFFIFTGVALYCAHDAAYNPLHEGQRTKVLADNTYSSAVGSCTAWFEPYVAPTVARVAGTAAASSWLGSALLPATLAYSTVKGCGWNDWGKSGLNDHEMRMNGLSK